MNPIALVKKGAQSTAHFVGRIWHDVSEVDAVYHSLTPEAKAALVRTFADVLAFVAAIEGASAAGGLNFVLDEQVLAIAKNLYADARLDKETALAVFKALDIALPLDNRPAKLAA